MKDIFKSVTNNWNLRLYVYWLPQELGRNTDRPCDFYLRIFKAITLTWNTVVMASIERLYLNIFFLNHQDKDRANEDGKNNHLYTKLLPSVL